MLYVLWVVEKRASLGRELLIDNQHKKGLNFNTAHPYINQLRSHLYSVLSVGSSSPLVYLPTYLPIYQLNRAAWYSTPLSVPGRRKCSPMLHQGPRYRVRYRRIPESIRRDTDGINYARYDPMFLLRIWRLKGSHRLGTHAHIHIYTHTHSIKVATRFVFFSHNQSISNMSLLSRHGFFLSKLVVG